MKIQLLVTEGEYGEEHELLINGEESLQVFPLCECPEDATIERDLLGGREVISFIKLGYEAGKNGEELEILPEGEISE